MAAGVSVAAAGPGRVRWSTQEPPTVTSATGLSTGVPPIPPLPPPPSGAGPAPYHRKPPQADRKCTSHCATYLLPASRLSLTFSETAITAHFLPLGPSTHDPLTLTRDLSIRSFDTTTYLVKLAVDFVCT